MSKKHKLGKLRTKNEPVDVFINTAGHLIVAGHHVGQELINLSWLKAGGKEQSDRILALEERTDFLSVLVGVLAAVVAVLSIAIVRHIC